MNDIFNDAVAGDARLMARWEATREKVLADALHAGLGEIDPESLKKLPGVKLAVFTDMGLPSDLLEEVKRLPEIAGRVRNLELKQKLEAGDSDLHDQLDQMTPVQRMDFGRKLDAAKKAEKAAANVGKPTMDADDEARMLLWLKRLPAEARLNAARAAGMI